MDQLETLYSTLANHLNAVSSTFKPNSQLTAMHRISRLPPQLFTEVVQDFIDELNRRFNPNNRDPFLPIRNDLPAKRNQARQKMATFGDQSFNQLGYELMLEIHKRNPRIDANDGNLRNRYFNHGQVLKY
jgi:hypothetical protein